MLGTLLCAALIIGASIAIGRALASATGWRSPGPLAGALGFAALVVVAPFLVRLPGRGLTAAILLALVAAVCVLRDRRASRMETEKPLSRGGSVAVAVAAAAIALACLPFVFNDRTGVLGEGIYTNDQAAQLYWADWLADGFGPQPNAVSVGYPVGPQALAATVSEGTGVNLVDAFNGMLVAIPALTALAALGLLGGLAPLRRGIAAVLSGIPFLGASFLAQSGFKETAMALFVVALAVVLHRASPSRDDDERVPAWSAVGAVALLAAASVFTFSIPGGVWFGVAVPVWALLTWGFATERPAARVRERIAEHRRALLAGAVALLALAALALGPASGFIDRIDAVQESSGRLSSPVWPGEALGIWPEGDFRLVRGEVDGALLATGFASLCVALAAFALLRRREWALVSVLGAAGFVYALARPFAEIHVEAKALAVLAPITMLVTLRFLLASAERGLGTLRLALGSVFAALALGSTFVALRAAPVGFDGRGHDLEALADEIDGEKVVFLGVDRFAAYWLRGTLIESPGGYVPPDVDARPEKTWQQGLALDFDTLSPSKLDNYRYAVTTSAGYASTPPPNWTEVATEGDYVLWERDGRTPATRVLDEGGEPGAVFGCNEDEPISTPATVLTEPVTIDQGDWDGGYAGQAPRTFTASAQLDKGQWSASLQYHSQVPLSLRLNGEEVAELPPTLEGFYLVGAGRGAFWPAGETGGGTVEVEVEASEPTGLQDALGVERKVWLGTLAFTAVQEFDQSPLGASCGQYVDHYQAAP